MKTYNNWYAEMVNIVNNKLINNFFLLLFNIMLAVLSLYQNDVFCVIMALIYTYIKYNINICFLIICWNKSIDIIQILI